MGDNHTWEAARRLLALPEWYERFCAGPHPYADPGRAKQDSGDIMVRVGADIRAVCGAVLAGKAGCNNGRG